MNLKGLADISYCRREYDLAEPLYRQTLAIREKVLGNDHPFVATSLIDLGNLAYMRGRYAEAVPLFRRALTTLENTLGAEHPRVASTLACPGIRLPRARRSCAVRATLSASPGASREKLARPTVPVHPDLAGILENYACGHAPWHQPNG